MSWMPADAPVNVRLLNASDPRVQVIRWSWGLTLSTYHLDGSYPCGAIHRDQIIDEIRPEASENYEQYRSRFEARLVEAGGIIGGARGEELAELAAETR